MPDIVVYSTASGPSASGAVAATSALSAGRYRVTVATELSGTVGTADINNMQVQSGTAVIGRLLTSENASLSGTIGVPFQNAPFEVDVPYGGGTISVNAVGNASGTAAVYGAQLVISPIAQYE